ncbi:uroporphyrinogen decarboxylase family protein [Bacteroidota bacterium]
MTKNFDISLSDSQATDVVPIQTNDFDFAEYVAYTEMLNEKCERFWKADSGVLVYRRMRVAECFSYGCRDMENSLHLQLGALKKSMKYLGDVPNFLEPWYGIGTISSAFGGEYIWQEHLAPALKISFSSLQEVLDYEPTPVAKTNIGKHTLEMIDFFMDKTKGLLPISLTDSQSPLNMVGQLCPIDHFLIEMLVDPEKAQQLLEILADLSIAFNEEQLNLIGNALVSPGHGFASSRTWKGLGMSDDNAIMISPAHYTEIVVNSVKRIGDKLGGPAFHSCGNWEQWIDDVLNIDGLIMADGAFSLETDPDAISTPESFHKFKKTGVVLNARIVGDFNTIEETVKRIWTPGMKLVVVTYCRTPEEQASAYHRIHEICV